MRPTRVIASSALATSVFLAAVATPQALFAETDSHSPPVPPPVSTPKTLHRVPDPVVMRGADLGTMAGTPLARFALFAVTESGALAPIPFQIDERTADDAGYVYPAGKEKNPEAGNGLLDAQDELAFMAEDCGPRIAPVPWPAGAERGSEIAVTDPVDGTQGFVYLFVFAASAGSPPPRSDRSYVHYDPVAETITSSSYTMSYEPGKERIFFSGLSIPPGAGGTGESFVDRLKIRTSIETKLFFSISFDEDEWQSSVAAWLNGPVRAMREVRNKLAFLGIPVAPTIRVEGTFYRDFHVAPSDVHQTIDFPGIARSAWFQTSVDLNDRARGMRYYRPSRDTDTGDGWHTIDGTTTPDEKNLDPKQPDWHLVTGPPGTFIWWMKMPKPLQPVTDLVYSDDASTPDPPETTPGTIGEIGYHVDLMPLAEGDYHMKVFYLFPPHYQPGMEKRWLEMITDPVQVEVRALAGKE